MIQDTREYIVLTAPSTNIAHSRPLFPLSCERQWRGRRAAEVVPLFLGPRRSAAAAPPSANNAAAAKKAPSSSALRAAGAGPLPAVQTARLAPGRGRRGQRRGQKCLQTPGKELLPHNGTQQASSIELHNQQARPTFIPKKCIFGFLPHPHEPLLEILFTGWGWWFDSWLGLT